MRDDEGILNIDLDDLDDDGAGSFEYPALTAEQLLANSLVSVSCLCSRSCSGFVVQYEEIEPGIYRSRNVVKRPPEGTAAAAEVQGTFELAEGYACPHCGNGSLALCDECGAILCKGGMTSDNTCPCPGCQARLSFYSSAGWTVSASKHGKSK